MRPLYLTQLIERFKKFPGVGSKMAERFAFHLLTWPQEEREKLGHMIGQASTHLLTCQECGAIRGEDRCLFCQEREPVLLVVQSQKEVFAFEETDQYRGYYHVLGSLFSPLDEQTVSEEQISKLISRIKSLAIQEVILALDATLEGDATALYLKERLQKTAVTLSRLAFGLPINSALEFADGSTLSCSLRGRSVLAF